MTEKAQLSPATVAAAVIGGIGTLLVLMAQTPASSVAENLGSYFTFIRPLLPDAMFTPQANAAAGATGFVLVAGALAYGIAKWTASPTFPALPWMAKPQPPKFHSPTIKEYFMADLPGYMMYDTGIRFEFGGETIEILVKEREDYNAVCKFISFYIPRPSNVSVNNAEAACTYLADNLHAIIKELGAGVGIETYIPGDHAPVTRSDLTFTGAVYIYHDCPLTVDALGRLYERYAAVGARAIFRSTQYVSARALGERASDGASRS